MSWTALIRLTAGGVLAVSTALAMGVPAAHAQPDGVCNPLARNCADTSIVGDHVQGDTHITGQGIIQTLDCGNRTLLVFGTNNQIHAMGTCWAVTVQGSSNVIVADTVVNDITVYGWDQTVLFRHGDPVLWDRGRELGMTNRLNRVPA